MSNLMFIAETLIMDVSGKVSAIGDKIDAAVEVMTEKPEGFFDFANTKLGVICIMVIVLGSLFMVSKDVLFNAKTKKPASNTKSNNVENEHETQPDSSSKRTGKSSHNGQMVTTQEACMASEDKKESTQPVQPSTVPSPSVENTQPQQHNADDV